MKINDIQFKDYYAIARQKKNSETVVLDYTEYKTFDEAFKEAKTLNEFDLVHTYSVKHIQKYERYFDDSFSGIVTNTETVAIIK